MSFRIDGPDQKPKITLKVIGVFWEAADNSDFGRLIS